MASKKMTGAQLIAALKQLKPRDENSIDMSGNIRIAIHDHPLPAKELEPVRQEVDAAILAAETATRTARTRSEREAAEEIARNLRPTRFWLSRQQSRVPFRAPIGQPEKKAA